MVADPKKHAFSTEMTSDATKEHLSKRPRTNDVPIKPQTHFILDIDPRGDMIVAVKDESVQYMRIPSKRMTTISEPFQSAIDEDLADSLYLVHDTADTAFRHFDDDVAGMRMLFELAHL